MSTEKLNEYYGKKHTELFHNSTLNIIENFN